MRRLVLAMIVFGSLAGPVVAEDGKVPLKTQIPEEMLVGTPPDVLALLYPHLTNPLAEKAKDFLVPEGTVNLALNRRVTASDDRPLVGELSFVTDGKKKGDLDSYMELPPKPQWVQIHLDEPSTIHALYVWHYFREARGYEDVVVQVADDAEFEKNVRTIFNTDQDNSLKFGIGKDRPYIETNHGKLIDAKSVTAQFVRLYSNGSTADGMNHYVEVEVFGEPAE